MAGGGDMWAGHLISPGMKGMATKSSTTPPTMTIPVKARADQINITVRPKGILVGQRKRRQPCTILSRPVSRSLAQDLRV